MLNPSDIAGKKFDKGMGRGYKAEEVDAYLNQVADEMNDLIAQNRDLEHKMMVLADKLEEYKQDEESLRSALIGAQKLGDSVVREAKAKAASIVEDAKVQAGMLVENAKHAIEKEQNAYIRLQREVATFKSKLQLL
ncbi:DivIVA domain-containing protein, partial [Anaerotruncus rubiinfantis]